MRNMVVRSTLIACALVPTLALPLLAQGVRQFGSRPFGPWVWAFGLMFFLRGLLLVSLLVVAWRLIGARTLFHRPDSATQILRERYARGEISEEEYRKRLVTLA